MRADALDGRVALVTGGASGIGRAAAAALVEAGAAVMIADRDEVRGRETATMLGPHADFTPVDVSVAASVADMVGATLSRFGRLDCAFNNAGIPDGARSLLSSSQANWDAVMATNLEGVWLCMKAELDNMLAQGGGVIVNNASRSALVGVPTDAVYGAAKHGVVGLTKAAAVEFGSRGVRVNAICPGLIDTPLTRTRFGDAFDAKAAGANPLGRAARPEEIGRAVAWLCSDAASFVTGVALPIDGGATAR